MSTPGKSTLLCLLAVGALLLAAPWAQAATASPEPAASGLKRVLILYDEDKDNLPGLAAIDRALRESFRIARGRSLEIHSESLNLSQFERPGDDAALADFYRRKYANAPPDVIVAVLEPSLEFLLRHSDTLFPGTPIVFSGVDAATTEATALPGRVTGVLVKRTFSPTLEIALRLQPETRNVFVVGGASSFDRYLEKLVRRDLKPFESRVAITYLFGMPMDGLLTRLANLPAHSAILYTTVFADSSGRRFVPHEVLASISTTANAPVYVFLDQYLGLGAVGGNVYSADAHEDYVVGLAMKILEGATPASLPVRAPAAQVDLFDARQLKRWNLDEARLPEGSIVRYREVSAWDTYRWYIVGALAVIVTQGALIGGLLLARTRQRRAEAQALRERDDLAHVLRVTTLGELTSSLAHEINQPLGAILANAQAATLQLAHGSPADATDIQEALGDIEASAQHASQVIGRVRKLFRKQHVEPLAVDMRALIEDVVRLLHAAMLTERIDIRLALAEVVPAVFGDPVQLEQVMLNVVRNACDAIGAGKDGPRTVTIELRQSRRGYVLIEVADTGIGAKGADLERIFEHFVTTKPNGLGMGLAISRSIIEAHGGNIWASANPDRGLTVHIELAAHSAE